MATRERQHTSVTLRLRRSFPAPPERVFRAWTTPAEMKQWKAPGDMTTPVAEVDLRPGGKYGIHMRAPDGAEHHLVGVYRVVEPPRKLVYTWRWENEPDAPETLVTVEFLARGNATDLVLTHELFPTDEARAKHEHGWTGCFVKLARVVEQPQ
jgi:uncharacterized protein YndB with AHSA1/START domain